MYTIGADTDRRLLEVQCSGRLSTAEAVRATSQTASLLEAGALTDVLCDLSRVRRGPGSLLLIAATIASRHAPAYRIAFVVSARQSRVVQRVVRFSGIRKGLVVLRSRADAASWLAAGPVITAHRFSGTELRHAEHLLGGLPREAPAVERSAHEAVGAEHSAA